MTMAKRSEIDSSQCKGCGYCKAACPRSCIEISKEINAQGYNYAVFAGAGRCVACGICFYVCPEPGAITVYKDIDDGRTGK